jgi:antitoxin component of MazEF toxin-antitoxin module
MERKKHLTTKERIAAFCGTMEDVESTETDWGKPQGQEVW